MCKVLSFSWFVFLEWVNPGVKLSSKVKSVCKLSGDQLVEIQGAEPWERVVVKFYKFLKQLKDDKNADKLCLVTYNGRKYDLPLLLREEGLLSTEPDVNGQPTKLSSLVDWDIDVYSIVTSELMIWPNNNKPSKCTLSNVYEALTVGDTDKTVIEFHTAMGDVDATTIALDKTVDIQEYFIKKFNYETGSDDDSAYSSDDDEEGSEVITMPFRVTENNMLLASMINHPNVIVAMYIIWLENLVREGKLRFSSASRGIACDGYHVHTTKDNHIKHFVRFGVYRNGLIGIRLSALAYAVVNGSYYTMMDHNKTITSAGETYQLGIGWVISPRNNSCHLLCQTDEILENMPNSSTGRNAAVCIAIGHVMCADLMVNLVVSRTCIKCQFFYA